MHNSFQYAIIEAEAREFFSIDSNTGVITLEKDLDFESTEMHAFTVSTHLTSTVYVATYSTLLQCFEVKPSVYILVVQYNSLSLRYTE